MSLHRIAVGFAACVVLMASAPEVGAKSPGPLCGSLFAPPISSECAMPNGFVLIGHIENARGTPKDGTTDFVIGRALKSHAALDGKKVITLPQYIEIPDPKKPPRFVAFGVVEKGEISIYRGFVETPELVRYVEGLLKIDSDDRAKVLRYAFDFLEPKDDDVGTDALRLFLYAADSELRAACDKLDPVLVRKRFVAKDANQQRADIYARMLGYCGQPADAVLLRKQLDDPDQRVSDGLLIGYISLDKKAGYEYLKQLIADPENEFVAMHAALKALRYFWANRPAVLTRTDVLGGMIALMEHADIADLPIDDLRRWEVWELTPQVLHIATLESHRVLPINRRAVLKFAIAASWADPKNKAAAAFVEEARKNDPERVKLLEDLLKHEAEAARKVEVAPMPRSRK